MKSFYLQYFFNFLLLFYVYGLNAALDGPTKDALDNDCYYQDDLKKLKCELRQTVVKTVDLNGPQGFFLDKEQSFALELNEQMDVFLIKNTNANINQAFKKKFFYLDDHSIMKEEEVVLSLAVNPSYETIKERKKFFAIQGLSGRIYIIDITRQKEAIECQTGETVLGVKVMILENLPYKLNKNQNSNFLNLPKIVQFKENKLLLFGNNKNTFQNEVISHEIILHEFPGKENNVKEIPQYWIPVEGQKIYFQELPLEMLEKIFSFVFQYELSPLKNKNQLRQFRKSYSSPKEDYDFFFKNIQFTQSSCLFFESTMLLISKQISKNIRSSKEFDTKFLMNLKIKRWRSFIDFSRFIRISFVENVLKVLKDCSSKGTLKTKRRFLIIYNLSKNFSNINNLFKSKDLRNSQISFFLSHYLEKYINTGLDPADDTTKKNLDGDLENYYSYAENLFGSNQISFLYKKDNLRSWMKFNFYMNYHLDLKEKEKFIDLNEDPFNAKMKENQFSMLLTRFLKQIQNISEKEKLDDSDQVVQKNFFFFYDSLDETKKIVYFLVNFLEVSAGCMHDAVLASLHYLKQNQYIQAYAKECGIPIKKETIKSLLSEYTQFFKRLNAYEYSCMRNFIESLIKNYHIKHLLKIFRYLTPLLTIIKIENDKTAGQFFLDYKNLITEKILLYVKSCDENNANKAFTNTQLCISAKNFINGCKGVKQRSKISSSSMAHHFHYKKLIDMGNQLQIEKKLNQSNQQIIANLKNEKEHLEQKVSNTQDVLHSNQEVISTIKEENSNKDLLLEQQKNQINQLILQINEIEKKDALIDSLKTKINHLSWRIKMISLGILLATACFAVYKFFSKKISFA